MNQKDINLIKLLGSGDTLESLKALRDELTSNWIVQGVAGETEFQYLRNSFLRDGKIEGINIFIRELKRIMYEQQH